MTDLNDPTNQITVLTLIQTNQSTVYRNKAVIAQTCSHGFISCVQVCSKVPCFCVHMIPN